MSTIQKHIDHNTRRLDAVQSWLAYEFSIVRTRSIAVSQSLVLCDTPDNAFAYWKQHIQSKEGFNSDCEHIVVLLLDTRNRIRGHQVVGIGTVDSVLMHPREVFRTAILSAASGIVLMHTLCAASHKLCYVLRQVMWSRMSQGMA